MYPYNIYLTFSPITKLPLYTSYIHIHKSVYDKSKYHVHHNIPAILLRVCHESDCLQLYIIFFQIITHHFTKSCKGQILRPTAIQRRLFAALITFSRKRFRPRHKFFQRCFVYICKGQILRSTPNTAPLICGAYNTQPEGLSTMA